MSLLTVILTLAVVLVVAWLIDAYVPETARTAPLKTAVIVLIVICSVIWLLQISGLLALIGNVTFPHR